MQYDANDFMTDADVNVPHDTPVLLRVSQNSELARDYLSSSVNIFMAL